MENIAKTKMVDACLKAKDPDLDGAWVRILELRDEMALVTLHESPRLGFWWPLGDLIFKEEIK